MPIYYFPLFYGILMNLLGIYIMYSDKKNAQKNKWRTKEQDIFQLAIFGGALGVFLGMKLFRHKTKHKQFTIGIPIILTVNIACYIAAFFWLLK